MTFPTTSILDDFNRADATPPSASWSAMYGGGTPNLSIISQVVGGSDESFYADYWNPNAFGPNSEVHFDIPTKHSSDEGLLWASIRLQSPATTGIDGYEITIGYATAIKDTCYCYRLDNGAWTQLGAEIVHSFASGDSFGFEAIGSTLTGYHRASGGGAWHSIESRTDATYGAGYIGCGTYGTTTRLDNFCGGSASSPKHPAIIYNDPGVV